MFIRLATGVDVVNKFKLSITTLFWNKALWWDVVSHVNSINFRVSYFRVVQLRYSEICLRHRFMKNLCWVLPLNKSLCSLTHHPIQSSQTTISCWPCIFNFDSIKSNGKFIVHFENFFWGRRHFTISPRLLKVVTVKDNPTKHKPESPSGSNQIQDANPTTNWSNYLI